MALGQREGPVNVGPGSGFVAMSSACLLALHTAAGDLDQVDWLPPAALCPPLQIRDSDG